MKEIIEVTMLGQLSIRYKGELVSLPYSISNKSIQLLLILWSNLEDGVLRTQLIKMLYGNDDIANPASAFRVTVFRLRKMLADSRLPKCEYIKNENRTFRWNTEYVDLKIDAVVFARKAKEALSASGEERLDKLVEACRLYSGEFLVELIGEEWIELEQGSYRQLYEECLVLACRLLMEKHDYETSLELSHAASEIYPYEEWFLAQIDSLIGLTRYQDAMKVYDRATELMFDEMGILPSEEMIARFQEMSSHIQIFLGGRVTDIQEKLTEKDEPKGAYYCYFPSFVDTYRLFSRMMERMGQSIFLMLCTLTGKDHMPVNDPEKMNSLVGTLHDSIEHSLRRGDLFTRYGKNQFLILLTGAKQESCSIISKRIEKNFKVEPSTRGAHVVFLVSSAFRTVEGGKNEKFSVDEMKWEKI